VTGCSTADQDAAAPASWPTFVRLRGRRVTIAETQVDFANAQASERGVADAVRFHLRNMLDTGFDTGSRQAIWTNETTMYVDLNQLFGEFARLLSYGGRYVCITGCYNDVTGGRSQAVSQIDQHYLCNIHPRSEYFRALAANNFVPINVIDLTAAAIPYWELRAQSPVATGIEEPFSPPTARQLPLPAHRHRPCRPMTVSESDKMTANLMRLPNPSNSAKSTG